MMSTCMIHTLSPKAVAHAAAADILPHDDTGQLASHYFCHLQSRPALGKRDRNSCVQDPCRSHLTSNLTLLQQENL